MIPVDRFLTFIQIESKHTGKNLQIYLLNYFLETESINCMDCQAQPYDKMPPIRLANSMKCRSRKDWKLTGNTHYCSAHSLNLAAASEVDCCVNALIFFGFVQQLLNFSSSSLSALAHRWSNFNKGPEWKGWHTVKFTSEIRWSARADAVKALSLSAEYMARSNLQCWNLLPILSRMAQPGMK